jgi:4-amino-4-deoxy-L-arabinose transferase-like glycosyltransferase
VGLIIFALAIGVRVVWVLLVPTRPVGDFAMYIESARYLAEHRSLDPEFIYMPGYVGVVAVVHALGGGLLAIKMIGVVAGGVAAAAVYATTRLLFGAPAALVAGLLAALWPGGVAVASVTATDMPGAALIAIAVWLLVRDAGRRPLGAPVMFGLVLGLAAYVRAVALPLVLLSAPHYRARGAAWGHVLTRTVAACLVAVLVLLPWAIRNKLRYGELMFTDAHGGHTALVGANPNSEGRYSRSLNRMFTEGTGHKLFASPHRESDRVAFGLAKQWTSLSPKYAVGLLAAKADRLLTNERQLLYWPLYRQSVLPDGSRVLTWFAVHRTGVERLVDWFWYVLIAASLVGVVAAFARRNRAATSLLPMPLALAALYTLFFGEARYHLAIVILMLPFAGAGLLWVGEAVRDLARFTIDRQRRPRLPIEGVVAAVIIALLFIGWPRMLSAGARLRAQHRWAAAACTVAGAPRVCAFRATLPAPGQGDSPVRGVWDGFGLRFAPPAVAAATDLALPAGKYSVSMRVEAPMSSPVGAEVALIVGGAEVRRTPWPATASPIALTGAVTHGGGKLHIEIRVDGRFVIPDGDVPALWVSAFEVDAVNSPSGS